MAEAQEQEYIQKKLLYNKFDKKLDIVLQEYLKQMFSSSENPPKISKEELLDEIQSLEFINFKYRTALLSSNKDLIQNEEELLNQESKIQDTREEIKSLQESLQRAQIAKQNKRRYNEIGQELKKFDKKETFDNKMEELEEGMKSMEDQYEKDMKNYESRERYLRASISALKSFLNEINSNERPQQPIQHYIPEKFNSVSGEMEDQGQIQ